MQRLAFLATDVRELVQSAQVITSLADAVKELVENAIDAGARKISIRFTADGLEAVEVIDDGSGVSEDNLENLVTAHATNKLRSFGDLDGLETLGFRGEALSSLCALSTLTITTCTESTYPRGTQMTYDHDGKMKTKSTVSAQKGTVVRLERLFATLPVRLKDFEKNTKKEFSKAVKLMQAYAAIQHDIRIEATHTTARGRVHVVGHNGTSGSGKSIKTLFEVFGIKPLANVVRMETVHAIVNPSRKSAEGSSIKIEGFISNPLKETVGQCEHQLCYINSRPCHLPQLFRVVNETYSALGGYRRPFLFLNLLLPPDSYDVNVSPDKRTIFLHNEEEIMRHLSETLHGMFSEESRDIASTGSKLSAQGDVPPSDLTTRFALGSLTRVTLNTDAPVVHSVEIGDTESGKDEAEERVEGEDEDEDEVEGGVAGGDEDKDASNQIKRTNREGLGPQGIAPSTPISIHASRTFASAASSLRSSSGQKRKRSPVSRDASSIYRRLPAAISTIAGPTTLPSVRADDQSTDGQQTDATVSVSSSASQSRSDDEMMQVVDDAVARQPVHAIQSPLPSRSELLSVPDSTSSSSVKPLQRFVARLASLDHSSMSTQVHNFSQEVDAHRALADAGIADIVAPQRARRIRNAGIQASSLEAEQSLSLNVTKQDFFGMNIVGQFNLGFIITERHGELFIIDQHASDEKSNYERLLRETDIKSQVLAQPKRLDLNSLERLNLSEPHTLERLHKNGFQILVRGCDGDLDGDNAVLREEYWLTALPVSKNITFDTSDLMELLTLYSDGTSSTQAADKSMYRCTKAKRMFASRACRSSIMIGTALKREKMESVVYHMGELDLPWNCPHGRPTMRHLISLDTIRPWRDDYG